MTLVLSAGAAAATATKAHRTNVGSCMVGNGCQAGSAGWVEVRLFKRRFEVLPGNISMIHHFKDASQVKLRFNNQAPFPKNRPRLRSLPRAVRRRETLFLFFYLAHRSRKARGANNRLNPVLAIVQTSRVVRGAGALVRTFFLCAAEGPTCSSSAAAWVLGHGLYVGHGHDVCSTALQRYGTACAWALVRGVRGGGRARLQPADGRGGDGGEHGAHGCLAPHPQPAHHTLHAAQRHTARQECQRKRRR